MSASEDLDAEARAAQQRYRQVLAALGWGDHVDEALSRVPRRHEGLRAMALASLLVRAAGVEARGREARVSSHCDSQDVRAARVTTGPPEDPVVSDEERVFWELQRATEALENVLRHPAGQDDPWLSAALHTATAATDLLFGTLRRSTAIEDRIAGVGAQLSRAYLDRATNACHTALAAIEQAPAAADHRRFPERLLTSRNTMYRQHGGAMNTTTPRPTAESWWAQTAIRAQRWYEPMHAAQAGPCPEPPNGGPPHDMYPVSGTVFDADLRAALGATDGHVCGAGDNHAEAWCVRGDHRARSRTLRRVYRPAGPACAKEA